MRLYLDTEFNGHGGELISLALVADDGEMFYGIYDIPANPHPWVAENVIPALGSLALSAFKSREEFVKDFCKFAYRYRGAEIVADWPADIEHMCRLLSFDGAANGWRVPGTFTFRLIDRESAYNSEVPHNALHDACALRDYCKDWKI
jgi:hypothetical protein